MPCPVLRIRRRCPHTCRAATGPSARGVSIDSVADLLFAAARDLALGLRPRTKSKNPRRPLKSSGIFAGTRSRDRTGTAIAGHRILSPACLPIPPSGRSLPRGRHRQKYEIICDPQNPGVGTVADSCSEAGICTCSRDLRLAPRLETEPDSSRHSGFLFRLAAPSHGRRIRNRPAFGEAFSEASSVVTVLSVTLRRRPPVRPPYCRCSRGSPGRRSGRTSGSRGRAGTT